MSYSCRVNTRLLWLQIWEWVRKFCSATKATGQLCFDFMKDEDDGRVYAIECNPRCSSIFLNFYNHPNVAQSFFKPQACLPPSLFG